MASSRKGAVYRVLGEIRRGERQGAAPGGADRLMRGRRQVTQDTEHREVNAKSKVAEGPGQGARSGKAPREVVFTVGLQGHLDGRCCVLGSLGKERA